jgi:hypothetical protein
LSLEISHGVLQSKTINLLLTGSTDGVLHEVKISFVALLLDLLMINSDIDVTITIEVLRHIDKGFKEESFV